MLLTSVSPSFSAQTDLVQVSATQKATDQQIILDEINRYRAQYGLRSVQFSDTLSQIVQSESERMVAEETFYHTDNFWKDPRAGTFTSTNEVIALEYRRDPAALVAWWMGSPAHRDALLNPNHSVIGVGIAYADGSLQNTGQPWQILSTVNLYGYAPGNQPADTRPAVGGGSVSYAPQSPQITPIATGPFKDVPASHPHASHIRWVKDAGILNGWSDGMYRPAKPIGRYAAAAAFYRMAGSPAYTPPAVSPFTDVPTTHVFYKEIAWMQAMGLLNGWSDGTFRPDQNITRDQTAALFYRAAGSPNFPVESRPFNDVAPWSVFSKEISWMKYAGISMGYSDNTYRPDAAVTRGAMAAFLERHASIF